LLARWLQQLQPLEDESCGLLVAAVADVGIA
jgi:hypothetical protein